MTENVPAERHSVHLASLVPGRLRIKFPSASGNAAALDRLKGRLESREGVNGVRVNPVNRSVTVHYDQNHHGTAGILGLLEDVDVMVESIGHLPSINGQENPSSPGFIGATEDLNRRIRGLTGIPIDVKVLLPVAFLAAGVWSTLRKGLIIEAVPGWLFLWLAFDVYVKLHPPQPPDGKSQPEVTVNAEDAKYAKIALERMLTIT
jgi:hypothetical protein